MSILTDLWDSLFQPGLPSSTQRLMNFSFYALFVTLFALVILTGGNLHVLALLAVSVALWASVNWFLFEIRKLPPSSSQVQQMPSDSFADAAQLGDSKGQAQAPAEGKKEK